MTTSSRSSRLVALSATLCALGALALSSPAHAVSVTWELVGVVLEDSTPVTGSFAYDADSDTYSDWSLTVQPGGIFSGYEYAPGMDGGFVGVHNSSMADFVAFPPETSGRYLRLVFSAPLSNSGGFVPMGLGGLSFECDNCIVQRMVVDGAVTSVPEPAAWALMGLGLLAVGVQAKRRSAT
jgi:hypothetical protein